MSVGWPHDPERLRARISEVGLRLGALAAGYWELEVAEARLKQVVFVPGPALDDEVGTAFAAATSSVPLSQTGLGIVAAAMGVRPVVSAASELPGDSGSGRWLRAFGASRSVAVPVRAADGTVRGVISIALPDSCGASAEAVSDQLLTAFSPRTPPAVDP